MKSVRTESDSRSSSSCFTPEYETDSFERIQSSPSPLAGDPDPVQSGLVDQKPIQSSPIRYVRTIQIFVEVKSVKVHTYTYSFVSFLYEYFGTFFARNPSKRYMLYDNNDLSSNMKWGNGRFPIQSSPEYVEPVIL